ncbi:hypothetical protein [Sporomusa acidovorans]|uniref:Uncharacterized protein n=1 Tax=Sporomusa acidovorans (strain ATCC 49682 / DSM 3132 / Mol) TaxID=1123286 RepID=A0ABZ3J9Y9_SPOA4|nr:hypothetical protein [Sporomusa acidovorans]OZC22970.1 hypothetical protein SPACI_10430 [Sporomusa acidovorans DSM 3132]SDE93707.1 hypothetical protein SAMN04488499_102710 [Sporomusa acidovorans]
MEKSKKRIRIRIIRASSPDFWYAKKIGQEFQVLSETKDSYRVNVGDPAAHYVAKRDCETVSTDQRTYFGDMDSVPDDEWIDAAMDGDDEYLLQYAILGETIYYRLLGDNDDVIEHGMISKTAFMKLFREDLPGLIALTRGIEDANG